MYRVFVTAEYIEIKFFCWLTLRHLHFYNWTFHFFPHLYSCCPFIHTLYTQSFQLSNLDLLCCVLIASGVYNVDIIYRWRLTECCIWQEYLILFIVVVTSNIKCRKERSRRCDVSFVSTSSNVSKSTSCQWTIPYILGILDHSNYNSTWPSTYKSLQQLVATNLKNMTENTRSSASASQLFTAEFTDLSAIFSYEKIDDMLCLWNILCCVVNCIKCNRESIHHIFESLVLPSINRKFLANA